MQNYNVKERERETDSEQKSGKIAIFKMLQTERHIQPCTMWNAHRQANLAGWLIKLVQKNGMRNVF